LRFASLTGKLRAFMSSEVAELPVSHKLWAWFETNRKQAIWGAVIVVALGLIIWFFVWQQGEKEVNASEALSKVSTPAATTPTAKADPESYLKIASSYPKSSAAARALLLAGGSYFVEGKYAEAKTQFERLARDHQQSPFMGQALLGIAACLDAQGKTNEALTAYKDLADHHPGESVIPQAKFALARMYEAQGKTELARTLFEDLNRADPYGSLGSEAGMRLEELLAKNPGLVQKPVAATNSPTFKLQKP
jgi:TolA-binding protein